MYPNLQRHSSHGDRVKHGSHGDRQFIVSLQKFPQERSEKVIVYEKSISYSDIVIGFRIFLMLNEIACFKTWTFLTKITSIKLNLAYNNMRIKLFYLCNSVKIIVL